MISRNALTSRLCAHFALGPFSIGFPMSFPRSLRPEGASDPMTSQLPPGNFRGESSPPLPTMSPRGQQPPSGHEHSLPAPQPGDREWEGGRGTGDGSPTPGWALGAAGTSTQSRHPFPPQDGAPCPGFRLTPQGTCGEPDNGQGRSHEDSRLGLGVGPVGKCAGEETTQLTQGNFPKARLPAPHLTHPHKGQPWRLVTPQAGGHSPMALSILPRTWLLGMARPLS